MSVHPQVHNSDKNMKQSSPSEDKKRNDDVTNHHHSVAFQLSRINARSINQNTAFPAHLKI
jgi:hypothetical protein